MVKKKNKYAKYVGAGMMLGAGNVALGAMGQGAIAGKISGPASTMLGAGIAVEGGMDIMNYVNKKTKKGKY